MNEPATKPALAPERASTPALVEGRPQLDALGRRGRVLFFVGLVSYAVWELGVLGMQIAHDSPLMIQSIGRVVPGLILFFFAWRGRPWATILITLAFVVAMAAGLLTASTMQYGTVVSALIGGFTTWLGLFGIALQVAPSLRRYLAFQRQND